MKYGVVFENIQVFKNNSLMKKLLLLFLLACVMAPAGAQVYIGGSVSAWLDDNNGKETSTVTFLPEIGRAHV